MLLGLILLIIIIGLPIAFIIFFGTADSHTCIDKYYKKRFWE